MGQFRQDSLNVGIHFVLVTDNLLDGGVEAQELGPAFPEPDEDPGCLDARLGVFQGAHLHVGGVEHDPAVVDHVVPALDRFDQDFLQPVVAQPLDAPGFGGGLFLQVPQAPLDGFGDGGLADAHAPGDLGLGDAFAAHGEDHGVAFEGHRLGADVGLRAVGSRTGHKMTPFGV